MAARDPSVRNIPPGAKLDHAGHATSGVTVDMLSIKITTIKAGKAHHRPAALGQPRSTIPLTWLGDRFLIAERGPVGAMLRPGAN